MIFEDKDILTGQQLINSRSKENRDLPGIGLKEFQPTNSWFEKKQIENALSERRILLEEQRVEKSNVLSYAEWISDVKKAKVTKKNGKYWEYLGHYEDNTEWLYPEEALILLETNSLELLYHEVPLSIERGYVTLLKEENGCTLNQYRAFSYLARLGYRLFRHSAEVSVTKYIKEINLDQHVLNKKHTLNADNITKNKALQLVNDADKDLVVCEDEDSVSDIVVDENDPVDQNKSDNVQMEVEDSSNSIVFLASAGEDANLRKNSVSNKNVEDIHVDDDVIEIPYVKETYVIEDSSSNEDTSGSENDSDGSVGSKLSNSCWKRKKRKNVNTVNNSVNQSRRLSSAMFTVRTNYVTENEFLFDPSLENNQTEPNIKVDNNLDSIIELSDEEPKSTEDNVFGNEIKRFYKEIEIIDLDSDLEDGNDCNVQNLSLQEIMDGFPKCNKGQVTVIKIPPSSLLPPNVKPVHKEYRLNVHITADNENSNRNMLNRNPQYGTYPLRNSYAPYNRRNHYYRNNWSAGNNYTPRFRNHRPQFRFNMSNEISYLQQMANNIMQVATSIFTLPFVQMPYSNAQSYQQQSSPLPLMFNQMNTSMRMEHYGNGPRYDNFRNRNDSSVVLYGQNMNHQNNFPINQRANNFINNRDNFNNNFSSNSNNFNQTSFTNYDNQNYNQGNINNNRRMLNDERYSNQLDSENRNINIANNYNNSVECNDPSNENEITTENIAVGQTNADETSNDSTDLPVERRRSCENSAKKNHKRKKESYFRHRKRRRYFRGNLPDCSVFRNDIETNDEVPATRITENNDFISLNTSNSSDNDSRNNRFNNESQNFNQNDNTLCDSSNNVSYKHRTNYNNRSYSNQRSYNNNRRGNRRPFNNERSGWRSNFNSNGTKRKRFEMDNRNCDDLDSRSPNRQSEIYIIEDTVGSTSCRNQINNKNQQNNRNRHYNAKRRRGKRGRKNSISFRNMENCNKRWRFLSESPPSADNAELVEVSDSDSDVEIETIKKEDRTDNLIKSKANEKANKNEKTAIKSENVNNQNKSEVNNVSNSKTVNTNSNSINTLVKQEEINDDIEENIVIKGESNVTDIKEEASSSQIDTIPTNPIALNNSIVCSSSSFDISIKTKENENLSIKINKSHSIEVSIFDHSKEATDSIKTESTCVNITSSELPDSLSTADQASENINLPELPLSIKVESNDNGSSNISVADQIPNDGPYSNMEVKIEPKDLQRNSSVSNQNDTAPVAVKVESNDSENLMVNKDNLENDIVNKASTSKNVENRESSNARYPECVEKKPEIVSWAQLKENSQVEKKCISGERQMETVVIYPSDEYPDSDEMYDDDDSVQPIVKAADCSSLQSVLSALQIIGSADLKDMCSDKLKISYDVYLPNLPVKKSSRGLPNYRLVILSSKDDFPNAVEMAELNTRFEDGVSILLALVSFGSVTFYNTGTINLPTDVNNGLL